jgi:uncharacterized protein
VGKGAILKPNFDWDYEKAKANRKKHRVSFDEAIAIFNDPFSITISDPDHSIDEQRHIDIGSSDKGHILVVVYTERGSNIRIISYCKATLSERRFYEEKGN